MGLPDLSFKRRGIGYEFIVFVLKEARSCIFPGIFFFLLWASHHINLMGLPRYDFLFLAVLLAQLALLAGRIETLDEAKTLLLFHVIGLALEIFKTHPAIGSWSYPEEGHFKIGGVPLYSGFMYAGVASYMCQAWRLFDLRLTGNPPYRLSLPLSIAIYANFFTHHFLPDFRWLLLAGVFWVYRRAWVEFTITDKRRAMPLVLSFFLIGLFVWVAENVSTYLGAWAYPDQIEGWRMVSAGKISSWSLLVIISFIIVADLKEIREAGRRERMGPGDSHEENELHPTEEASTA